MVIYHSMVCCQKGPTRHAYTWQTGPFWQDTLVFNFPTSSLGKHNLFSFYKYQQQLSLRCILFQSVLKTLSALSGVEISSSRWLLQSLDGGAQVYLGRSTTLPMMDIGKWLLRICLYWLKHGVVFIIGPWEMDWVVFLTHWPLGNLNEILDM